MSLGKNIEMQTPKEKLTLRHLFLALAYYFAHFDSRTHFLFNSNKIRRIYLPPIWDPNWILCDITGGENLFIRKDNLISFLTRFADTNSNLKEDCLGQIQKFFDVCPIPTPHVILKKETDFQAKQCFLKHQKEIEIIAIRVLQTYLKHGEENKTLGGESSEAGLGLVLSLSVE